MKTGRNRSFRHWRILALCLLAVIALQPTTSWARRTDALDAPAVPVLVELFTSEGCDSCPAADQVLIGLMDEQPVEGVEIIALALHVDYWNRLGWADPYSSPQYSARQKEYADAFRRSGIYTPQMIVDGEAEFVGVDRNLALSAIRRAGASRKARVEIELLAGESRAQENVASVQVSVSGLRDVSQGAPCDVWLALTSDGLVSRVTRGENAGKTLRHSGVVRRLVKLGGANGQETTINFRVEIGAELAKTPVRLVAFVQDRQSKAILGAAIVELPF